MVSNPSPPSVGYGEKQLNELQEARVRQQSLAFAQATLQSLIFMLFIDHVVLSGGHFDQSRVTGTEPS